MSKIKAQVTQLVSRYLPTTPYPGLPSVSMPPGIRDGRSLHDGYQRGKALEFDGADAMLVRDPVFRRAHRVALKNKTHVSLHRLMNLYLIIRYFMPAESQNVIEFGSYSGGSALFMAILLKEYHPGAKVYALDTFGGMPETDPAYDLHSAGEFTDASIERITAVAAELGLDNLELVKGMIEDTAPDVYQRAGKFGLAHLDLDIYHPLKFAHETVTPYMAKGGYVAYDDATVSSCIGATQAVEEMIRNHGLHCEQIYPHFVFRAGL